MSSCRRRKARRSCSPTSAPTRRRIRSTPSGKIEIFSERIASFGYGDCPGHPVWLEPVEWLGAQKSSDYPLHLMSNQPRTRLHGQLDNGGSEPGKQGAGT